MLKTLRARLGDDRSKGLSLIEIMVAMMIFAIIALGVGYGLISTLTIARDNKAREVGSNLAASEIDSVRALADPFAVHDGSKTVAVTPTESYTVKTTTAWVTPTGNVSTCGTAGGPLQYKRVTIKVTWPSMRNEDAPVLVDTLLSPSKRINDPTKGTILVSVAGWRALGKAGVTFSISPSAGIGALTPTDSDGCSYILQVPAGTYTVSLTNTGMIDALKQQANPSDTKPVTVGSSTVFNFTYDQRARYKVNYASNYADAVRPLIPTNLDFTFFNTYGVYTKTAVQSGSTPYVDLHPYPTGYEAVAGKYVESAPFCTSVDPESWDPDTRVTPPLSGQRPALSIDPNVDATINVPMGVVNVKGGGGDGYLTAVSQPSVLLPGQPACATAPATTMTYEFGNVIPGSGSSSINVALPYGSWKFYTRSGSSAPSTTALNAGRITRVTAGSPVDTSTGEFALDPR